MTEFPRIQKMHFCPYKNGGGVGISPDGAAFFVFMGIGASRGFAGVAT
jgi:hypothetical protein